MITEDYVSFETALLLKKKGFEQIGCQKQYNTQGDLCVGYCYGPVAPTLQMAMKWLREVHFIWVSVFYGLGNTNKDKRFVKWEWEVYNMIDDSLLGHTKSKEECCDTYEEATENSIKYCLENLI